MNQKLPNKFYPKRRYLAKALAIPVELLEVVDSEALKLLANPERGRYIDTVLADRKASRQKLPGDHRRIVSGAGLRFP